LVGILAFSFTVPFTRVATHDGLPALFVGAGRVVVAATLAGAALIATRQPWPNARQWVRLGVIGVGIAVAFPLLTSYALTTAPASHGAVVIGLLPVATAVGAIVRGNERVPASFWFYATAGALAVTVFAALQNGGLGSLHWADWLLFGAVLAAAVGYAEGGLVARELGSWQTVSWALVLAAPLMTAATVVSVLRTPPSGGASQWLAFAYLALVSMYLGYFAWYRGLAIGPIAQVSQVQLVQPVVSILWAALLLRERPTWPTVIGGLVVVACARSATRARLSGARTVP
jgi:drug/metabolite transporter (DMT)-like permease